MATRANLESTIADDLARTDLNGQITTAVNTAIRAYRSTRLPFNEQYRVTATLTLGEAVIPLANLSYRFRNVDRVRLVRNSNDYLDLYRRDYNWIMSRQDIVTSTQPAEWCIYNNTVHFDSNADQTYTLLFDGVVDLGEGTSLSYSVSSEAAWFNDGRELIRHRAKRELYAYTLKDMELASLAKGAEDDALNTIKSDMFSLQSMGVVRPSEF